MNVLSHLGWQPHRESELAPHLVPGRVAVAHSGLFEVMTEQGEVRARLPGRLVRDGVDVAVGDWVGLVPGSETVRQVLTRSSAIVRHAAGRPTTGQTLAANVDVAFIVRSLGPHLEPRWVERYLALVWSSGAVPEIVLTKSDRVGHLDDVVGEMVGEVEGVALGVPVHVVSAMTGAGCDELRARVTPGATAVLLGSSGVGKSTLVNRFAGRRAMATGEVREVGDEGRHTTTHRQLIELPGGGLIIDTPGLRELQLWDADGLDEAFTDITELAASCRFADCSHASEPDCSVLAAVAGETLSAERLGNWRKLQRELQYTLARQDVRLQHEENRNWELRRREARERARRR